MLTLLFAKPAANHYTVGVTLATFSVTQSSTLLKYGKGMGASLTGYGVSSTPVALKISRGIGVASRTYSCSTGSVALRRNYVLPANPASITESLAEVSISRDYSLFMNYTAVHLTLKPFQVVYSIPAHFRYGVEAKSATLLKKVWARPGSLNFIATPVPNGASFIYGDKVKVAKFVLTRNDVGLIANKSSQVKYTLTMRPATMQKSISLTQNPATSYTLNLKDLMLNYRFKIHTEYVATFGNQVNMVYNPVIPPFQFNVTWKSAGLLKNTYLRATKANFTCTFENADLFKARLDSTLYRIRTIYVGMTYYPASGEGNYLKVSVKPQEASLIRDRVLKAYGNIFWVGYPIQNMMWHTNIHTEYRVTLCTAKMIWTKAFGVSTLQLSASLADAGMTYGKSASLDTSSVQVTSSDTNLRRDLFMYVGTTNVETSTAPVALTKVYNTLAIKANIDFSLQELNFKYDRVGTWQGMSFGVTPVDAALKLSDKKLIVSPCSYTIGQTNAALTVLKSIRLDYTNYVFTGKDAGMAKNVPYTIPEATSNVVLRASSHLTINIFHNSIRHL